MTKVELTTALEAAKRVAEKFPVRVVRFGMLKGYDEALLEKLFSPDDTLLFLEEGIEEGGFAQSLCRKLSKKGLLGSKTPTILAVKEAFIPHGNRNDLMKRYGLDADAVEKELIRLATT